MDLGHVLAPAIDEGGGAEVCSARPPCPPAMWVAAQLPGWLAVMFGWLTVSRLLAAGCWLCGWLAAGLLTAGCWLLAAGWLPGALQGCWLSAWRPGGFVSETKLWSFEFSFAPAKQTPQCRTLFV